MADKRVYLFDSTLRDGAQTQGVDFSADDKAAIALIKRESSPGLHIKPIHPDKYYSEARINSGDRIVFRVAEHTIFFVDVVKHDVRASPPEIASRMRERTAGGSQPRATRRRSFQPGWRISPSRRSSA